MLGIYCRISKEKEQGKDKSIEDQRLVGIELANKLGVEFEVYIFYFLISLVYLCQSIHLHLQKQNLFYKIHF